MNQPWFVTGTDTGVGKTWCTLALMEYFKNQGQRVVGMKPIATGGGFESGDLRNSDAIQIMAASNINPPYRWVNPYVFLPPISPYLAAEQENRIIQLDIIVETYQKLAEHADVVFVEGIGGWRVPFSSQHDLKDIVHTINAKIILVVGLGLGCVNHTLLTAETIQRDGCQLVGWIANLVTPDFNAQGSIEIISERLDIPLLAKMPCLTRLDVPQLATHIEKLV